MPAGLMSRGKRRKGASKFRKGDVARKSLARNGDFGRGRGEELGRAKVSGGRTGRRVARVTGPGRRHARSRPAETSMGKDVSVSISPDARMKLFGVRQRGSGRPSRTRWWHWPARLSCRMRVTGEARFKFSSHVGHRGKGLGIVMAREPSEGQSRPVNGKRRYCQARC